MLCATDRCRIVPLHTINAYRGSRFETPLILNLGLGWRWIFVCGKYNYKVKFSLHMSIKHMGSGGKAPLILNLGVRWRCVVSFTLPPLWPWGKRPWYTFCGKYEWAQSRSGSFGKEKSLLTLHAFETQFLGYVACSVVPVPHPGS